LERDPASVKRCYDINVLGTYYSAQLAAKQMNTQPRLNSSSGAGSIIMIASMAAHQASKAQYLSDYCSSKGAILSLVRELGVELSALGIRVNAISPG
jgi:sorbose reductase